MHKKRRTDLRTKIEILRCCGTESIFNVLGRRVNISYAQLKPHLEVLLKSELIKTEIKEDKERKMVLKFYSITNNGRNALEHMEETERMIYGTEA